MQEACLEEWKFGEKNPNTQEGKEKMVHEVEEHEPRPPENQLPVWDIM